MSHTEFSPITATDEDIPMIQKRSRGRCLCWYAVITTVICICFIIALAVVASRKSSPAPTVPSTPATFTQKPVTDEVRWCTINSDEQSKCEALSTAFTNIGLLPPVTCVNKAGPYECVKALGKEVDAFTTDGGIIFNNRSIVKPIMAEDYGYGDASYYAVAVIKKNSAINLTKAGLENKISCHTGYQKSAGWNMPMGKLKELGILNGCGDNLKENVTKLFSTVCAPGGGKTLCQGCQSKCTKNCSNGEAYCGYNGAFRCLVESGDVCFVKHTTVYENTDGNSNQSWSKSLLSSSFELLCVDGSRAPIGNYESCNLGKVPSHAVIVSINASQSTMTRVKQLLLIGQLEFGPATNAEFQLFEGSQPDLLFKSSTRLLIPLHPNCSSERFLGPDYLKSLATLNCQEEPQIPAGPPCVLPQYSSRTETTLRWCVGSQAEYDKCNLIASQAKASGNPLYIICLQADDESACADEVGKGTADMTNLDGGHIYLAGTKNYSLVPLAAEYYGVNTTGNNTASSYFAVAVIKSSDNTTNLTRAGLIGKKTCHTGYGKTAGWNVPIGFLANNGIINVTKPKCNVLHQVSELFGGSCVPGVDQNFTKLCAICKGPGNSNCTSQDAYQGYAGALKCLNESAGDIAFINHYTITAQGVNQSHFKLLCKNGSTAPVSAYETCNLQQVPSHALFTSPLRTNLYKEKVWALLNQLQKSNHSLMFNSTGGKNQIFKDNTKCLWKVEDGCTWYDFLGENYLNSTQALNCDSPVTNKPKICQFVHAC